MGLFLLPMRKLAAKIALLFVLFSFTGELGVNVIFRNAMEYAVTESDDASDKKEEENKTKEEKDKILAAVYAGQPVLIISENFHTDFFIRTDSYKSLPEMPPDLS